MFKSLFVFGSALMLSSSALLADTFAFDPAHTAVVFKINHANTSNTYGRFNKVAGSVDVTYGAVAALSATVESSSIDTNSAKRDEHLSSPDFFNVKEFPQITFKSTGVKKVDDATTEVTGDLTLHGTTKSVTVKLNKVGAGKNMQGKDIVGYETTFTIKRSEYGMTTYVGKGVGDEVTLMVSFEAGKQ